MFLTHKNKKLCKLSWYVFSMFLWWLWRLGLEWSFAELLFESISKMSSGINAVTVINRLWSLESLVFKHSWRSRKFLQLQFPQHCFINKLSSGKSGSVSVTLTDGKRLRVFFMRCSTETWQEERRGGGRQVNRETRRKEGGREEGDARAFTAIRVRER